MQNVPKSLLFNMKTLVFALLFLNYKGTEFLPEIQICNYYIFPTRDHQVASIQGLENLSLWQGLNSF